MKIVNFTPGLGNQIFEYVFVEYLRSKYPHHKIYGYYNAKKLRKHNGLEINNVFNVDIPRHTLWSNIVAWLCRKLNGIGIKGLKATDSIYSENAIYFDGWWQDKKFFSEHLQEIKFRKFILDEKNSRLLNDIKNSQSVSIHIRRGDYLTPENIVRYGNICTKEYYLHAINILSQRLNDVTFYVFSNDIQWVKENMQLINPVYVDNNKGVNSFIDMYLMTHCKGSILANSSFSYWGAMLNKNVEIVVYPQKWFNHRTPDMFPDNWIGI